LDQKITDKIADLNARNTFANHNGIVPRAYGKDWAVMALDVREESLNPLDMVHGGALYTMADCASGMAAGTDGRSYVTQAGSLNFLSPGGPTGTIEARAQVRRRGQNTCFVTVDITDSSGTLLASGTFTFFCIGTH